MLFRSLLAGLALAVVSTHSEAGPFRRSARPAYQTTYPPAFPLTCSPVYQPPAFVPTAAASAGPANPTTPAVIPASATMTVPGTIPAAAGGFGGDGLDEVNAKRAARGLRAFLRDEALTQAAWACAQSRAAHGQFGHTANDFAFVPPGAQARSAGCAAYPAGYGWMSCCVYDNHTYAGAAWVAGRDGKRYMHLFVR